MRLFEFDINKLKQGKIIDYGSSDISEAIDKIKLNCSDFLKIREKSKRFLYRGMNSVPDIFISQSRDSRSAIDGPTSSRYKRLADFYMKNMGITALRGNSTFCNSKLRDSENYGKIFFMFPINGFSFTYSKKLTGSSAEAYEYPTPDSGERAPLIPEDLTPLQLNILSRQFIYDNQIKTNNLAWPLVNGYDVWIRGRFIAVNFQKYQHEIYSEFNNSFIPSDISIISNPTEQQQIEAVSDSPSRLPNIRNASIKVEMAAVEKMYKDRTMYPMFYIKHPEVQKFVLRKDPYLIMNMNPRFITPEIKAYAAEQDKIKRGRENN